ncbi:MAG: peptidylprolyl isomerase [Rugosibacter sp.]|nr:MAG: peptidylprolyl isomerase [Rugosibacter sp.]
MLDSVRNNKRIVQGFLVLITIPFALWGVESYIQNSVSGDEVATVGKVKISQQEFVSALNQQQERLRVRSGGNFDSALFDTPQVRRQLLESLITRKLLTQQVRKAQLTVSDGALVNAIASIPEFQENNQFSKSSYETALSSQGLNKELFEARMRQDLAVQQLVLPIAAASIPGVTPTGRWLSIKLEQRDVVEAQVPSADYINQVKLSTDAVKKYYAEHAKEFELPEQVRAEFLVLSTNALLTQLSVSEEEVRARYTADINRYKETESRRASHILIAVAKNAPTAEVTSAKAKAEDLLAKLSKTPGSFAALAKEYSKDTQSADKGGDLGWFGRGLMTKPFEDAVFELKEGATSRAIRTDFGFHIIRVTGVKPEHVKSFDEVKLTIADELKRELGAKRYAEAAEPFGNLVYEQPDSLTPAAEKWKLPIQQTGWLSKSDKLPFPLNNKKLADALFGEDAVKKKHNTEAVEVSPGTLVAARVLEYKSAALQDFAAVKEKIENELIHEAALKLAIKDGEDKLSRLMKGEAVDMKWSTSKTLSQSNAHDLPSQALQAIFKARADKLPAYVGLTSHNNGYVVYRITALKTARPSQEDSESHKLLERYDQSVTEEEVAAWMGTLREQFPVEIKKSALEKR